MVNGKPLDLRFAYTPSTAYSMIDGYSESFRHDYLITELTLDLIYPIIYSTLFSWLLFFLYRNQKLSIYPYVIMLVDYLENIGIVILLYRYPERIVTIAWITSFFSTLKWILIIIVELVIVWGFLTIKKNKSA